MTFRPNKTANQNPSLSPKSDALVEIPTEARRTILKIVTNEANQKIFIDHYSRSRNAAHAVWLGGWAPKVGIEAVMIGAEFLKQPEVADALMLLAPSQIMTESDVLVKLSEIAGASMEDFVDIIEDPDGTMPDGSPQYTAVINLRKAQIAAKLGAVKKLKHGKFGIELELHDSLSALRLLGTSQGLFTQAVRQEDWRTAAVRDIRAGIITYDALMEAFKDQAMVDELFREAGVKMPRTIEGRFNA